MFPGKETKFLQNVLREDKMTPKYLETRQPPPPKKKTKPQTVWVHALTETWESGLPLSSVQQVESWYPWSPCHHKLRNRHKRWDFYTRSLKHASFRPHVIKCTKHSRLFLCLPILNISRLKSLYDICKTLQNQSTELHLFWFLLYMK